MASPTSARRAAQDHTEAQEDLDNSPPSPAPPEHPRPSISPLSAKASPVAVRNATMRHATRADDIEPIHITTSDPTDGDDDRSSSSLSDPDDDIEAAMQQNSSTEKHDTAEELAAHQSLEVDSEAETERLDHTPRAARKQLHDTGRTPSKLNQAAAADDHLSEPSSPIPTGPGAASSTSTVEATGKPTQASIAIPCHSPHLYADVTPSGKKRKRSDTAESPLSSADSELGESPRKRNHSEVAEGPAKDIEMSVDVHEEAETPGVSGVAPGEPDAGDARAGSPLKGLKGKKGAKPKGRPRKDATREVENEGSEVAAPAEGPSEEALAKAKDEVKYKPAAATAFEGLAKQFSAYRDKMYSEKLAAADAELELLNQADCKHPDFVRQVACIDARRAKQISESTALYRYKRESLRRTTLGERSQLHSQYSQFTRQLREDIMQQLGEDWYKIQNERRQSSQQEEDHYIYKFPSKKSDQVKQQAKYNQEVSVLSGVAKYVGFPAAPDINGAQGEMLEDDLKAMKISKRAQQLRHHQPVYFPNRTALVQPQSERLAHEQFIEQNAWARPQGPILNHGTPNLTHTPDWADGIHHAKHIVRNVSGNGLGGGSPFATPIPQRRALLDPSSSGTVPANSDPAEPASSVAAAPPTGERVSAQSGRDMASPLVVAKQRQNGGELPGYRNISNSTIDAPGSAERDREAARDALQGLSKDGFMHQHRTDAGQLHRATVTVEPKMHASFRPEAAYGTPGPFSISNGPR